MHTHLTVANDLQFLDVRLSTCENRRSIISKHQYKAYCNFGLRSSLRPGNSTSVQAIGRRRTSICTAVTQIPGRDLQLITDVDLLIIPDDVPSLLSMKDMVESGIEISVQDHTVGLVDQVHPLRMLTHFLILQWYMRPYRAPAVVPSSPRPLPRDAGGGRADGRYPHRAHLWCRKRRGATE